MPPSPRPSPSLSQPRLPRLYAIVDADVCARVNRAPLDVARAFLAGGAKWIQLRCKDMASGAFLELAHRLVEEARGASAVIIINDRADVARLSGAGGLHVGQTDLSPADARAVIGVDLILGLSTHTTEQWAAAVRQPVSYIAIGPVFGTGTKQTGYEAVGLGVVSAAAGAARASGLPAVAIGGITLDNAPSVIDAGAASVAVITDLVYGNPEVRCRAFINALK